MFPNADLYTLIYVPGSVSPILSKLNRHTSFLQKIPTIEKRYRSFLPLMPMAVGKFNLKGYDLVLSSSHCVAKGIRKSADSIHVSYVHAPMRYMWDRFDDYFGAGRASLFVRSVAKLLQRYFQRWDYKVSQEDKVDLMIANSNFIAEKIKQHYHRSAAVVHPFVSLERFNSPRVPGNSYLMVGAFAPYKRTDLAIRAFNELKLPLLIVGSGQDQKRLEKMAGPTVRFLGAITNEALCDLYAKCKAFIFPGVEDFGITPLEAMASGAPVVAYGQGGALDTITEETGLFFYEQTKDALKQAILKIESRQVYFDEKKCRERAREFSKAHFQQSLTSQLIKTWEQSGKDVSMLKNHILTGAPNFTFKD